MVQIPMSFIQDYRLKLNQGLNHIPEDLYYNTVKVFQRLKAENKTLYVGGNGGSCAISSHFVSDMAKGPALGHGNRIRTISLDNAPLLTAISNDIGYHASLSFQLETYLQPGDVVLLISSSGKSHNIVEAALTAKLQGNKLIALTGFDGGIASEADISFHVQSYNYGVVEDCHQSILHILSQLYFGRTNV